MGGQSFSWDFYPEANEYIGFTQDKAIVFRVLKQSKENIELLWQTYPQKDDFEFVKRYLNLKADYNKILQTINKDEHVAKAIKAFPGLRILNQDFEQTLFSFILSSTKSIKGIRHCIRELNYQFGEKVIVDDREVYLFPKTQVLANASESDLRTCKIGFRAKYLKQAAQKLLLDNSSTTQLYKNEIDTRKYLTSFVGVGDKIADCVMIFSLGYENFTPLDVWGKRIFTELYGLPKNMKYEEIREWGDNYFDGYAAWAGQFLFEYIRKKIFI